MKKLSFLLLIGSTATSLSYGILLCAQLDALEIRTAALTGPVWLLIPWVIRLLIGMVFLVTLSTLLLLFRPCKNFLRFSFFLSLPLPLLDLLYTSHLTPGVPILPVVLYLFAGILIRIFASTIPSYSFLTKRFSQAALYLSTTAALSLPFILNPLHPEAFRSSPLSPVTLPLHSLKAYLPENINQPYLLCFYTRSCPHCKKAAQRIYATLEPKLRKQVIAVFGGKAEGVQAFFSQSGTHFTSIQLPDSMFYAWAGNAWPSFMLVKDTLMLQHWDGRSFNYAELNRLPSLLSE